MMRVPKRADKSPVQGYTVSRSDYKSKSRYTSQISKESNLPTNQQASLNVETYEPNRPQVRTSRIKESKANAKPKRGNPIRHPVFISQTRLSNPQNLQRASGSQLNAFQEEDMMAE